MSGFGQVGLILVDDGSIRDADGNSLNRRDAVFLDQSTYAAGNGSSRALAAAISTPTAAVDIVVGASLLAIRRIRS